MSRLRSFLRIASLSSAALLACVACNDAVAKAKDPTVSADENIVLTGGARPRADAGLAPPVEVVSPGSLRPRAPESVGALESPEALKTLYEGFRELEDGAASEDVRIVQFGDSHTAADLETGAIRRGLVARFGDGGRGFVQLGKPWKSYIQEGVRTGMVDFSPERGGKKEKLYPGSEGLFGLGGASVASSKRGARAWAELSVRFSTVDVAYLQQPAGGSFELFVDGTKVAKIGTKGPVFASAFRQVDLPEGTHQIEVRAVGDGAVRVFGASLDQKAAGVTFDALGINGARATTLLSWNETHLAEQLRHRKPSLVVLAYGTNESGDDAPREVYERHLVDALGRVMRAAPSASCLLMGPPDRAIETKDGWVTSPRLLEIVESQRRLAKAARCAFYDQIAAMGGEGTIANWALEEPPRAQKDRVHLAREGYAQLGASFVADLLRGYAQYRADKRLPPSKALTKAVPSAAPPPPDVPVPGTEADPH